MVKRRSAPRGLPLSTIPITKFAKTAPRDVRAAISSASKPPCRLRKCVVKIQRMKIRECPVSQDPYFAPPNVDTSAFEPVRNSTMYVPQNVPRMPRPSPTKAKVAGPTVISPCRVLLKKISPAKPVPEALTTKKVRFFHRDQPPARSRSSVTRNVYEFLSESQIEDGNNKEDPAADIIQRMVKSGKACVMIPSKTGGKLRAKIVPKKRLRPVGKRKKCSLENVAEGTAKTQSKNPRPLRQRQAARALSPIYEPEDDSSNDTDEIYTEHVEVNTAHPSVQSTTSKQTTDGAYSHLARSMLLNQTKVQDEQQSSSRRRDLLDMARQLVSTPLNSKAVTVPGANLTTHAISPIPRQTTNVVPSPGGGISPWRVSDESAMPNTFMFGFNNSQLPSYSSDHMHQPRHVYVPDTPVQEPTELENREESFCNTLHDSSPIADTSNEENRPPPIASRSLKSNEQENVDNEEDSENFVHLPNPRRTLQKRKPFQDINILDVVVLPPWKKNVPVTPSKGITSTRVSTPALAMASPAQHRSQTRANLFGYDEILPCEDQPRKTIEPRASSSRNLFGFEEFLTETEVPSDGSTTLSQNRTLPDRLHRLGDLRPRDNELPQVSSASLRLDCFGEAPLCQRDIREAFCSTMIAPKEPPKRKAALAADESVGLFRDNPEPETTFDQKKPRRTYVKERPKRKRKQRVHVLFIESGSSEDEDEQDSQENSVDSPQKKQQVKRPRKDVEHEAKLREFITSFNKECEEVEKFSMIIE